MEFQSILARKALPEAGFSKKALLMVIDVGMAAWFTTQFIVTRDPIILQAHNPLNLR